MLVGIFGGTFDPIHYGHLRTVAQVHQYIQFEKVLFIPSAVPPHREVPVATVEQRVQMLRLALNEYPQFEVDQRELHRTGPSYTVDTLRSLHEDFSNSALCLIIGMDAFLSINTWHQWQEIPTLAHLVVMRRPGWSTNENLPDWCWQSTFENTDAVREKNTGAVCMCEVDLVDISASAIRRDLKQGNEISRSVPLPVQNYILENKLYQ
ncbi:MAG: nicotinate-nucleotide adenylyltransferase [Gammaproteobacteria bacterium]|nr:nicotinate-nucleotide adenylyltransferase [Gammaproteobacteria bacterium]